MRILALDSATARCSATLVSGDDIIAGYHTDVARGQASLLAVMLADCLSEGGVEAGELDLIAVTVGPGSFTGLRGAIALAQGLGLAAGIPVVGVTVAEAIAESLPQLGGRELWVAIASRRGRVFLEIGDRVLSVAVDALPVPSRPVAAAGWATPDIASRLAARGVNVMLTDARLPSGRHIAAVAARRFRGAIRPLPAEPLYVDPPEARPRAPALP